MNQAPSEHFARFIIDARAGEMLQLPGEKLCDHDRVAQCRERGFEERTAIGSAHWRKAKASQRSSMMSITVDFRVEHCARVTFVPLYDARASSFFS
jgi:hypothetical protein